VLCLVWTISTREQGTLGAAPCDGPPGSALRAWHGRWYIATSGGRLQGETLVGSAAGDCATLERWHGTSGGNGYSLAAFDTSSGRWHYLFVNDTGIVITATGRTSPDSLRWVVPSFSEARDPVGEVWDWTLRPPIVHRGRVGGRNGFSWSFRYFSWTDSLPPVSRHNGPCQEDPARHTLDGLLGSRTLVDSIGRVTGRAERSAVLDHCAILDTMAFVDGASAIRLPGWDPHALRWQQLDSRSDGAARLQTLSTDAARSWSPQPFRATSDIR
jgi:hypothetical protein